MCRPALVGSLAVREGALDRRDAGEDRLRGPPEIRLRDVEQRSRPTVAVDDAGLAVDGDDGGVHALHERPLGDRRQLEEVRIEQRPQQNPPGGRDPDRAQAEPPNLDDFDDLDEGEYRGDDTRDQHRDRLLAVDARPVGDLDDENADANEDEAVLPEDVQPVERAVDVEEDPVARDARSRRVEATERVERHRKQVARRQREHHRTDRTPLEPLAAGVLGGEIQPPDGDEIRREIDEVLEGDTPQPVGPHRLDAEADRPARPRQRDHDQRHPRGLVSVPPRDDGDRQRRRSRPELDEWEQWADHHVNYLSPRHRGE